MLPRIIPVSPLNLLPCCQHLHSTSQKELKFARDECNRSATDKQVADRAVEREHKAMLRYRQMYDESNTPLLMAQQETQSLKKELEIYKKREDTSKKEVDVLEREKNLQLTVIQKVEGE